MSRRFVVETTPQLRLHRHQVVYTADRVALSGLRSALRATCTSGNEGPLTAFLDAHQTNWWHERKRRVRQVDPGVLADAVESAKRSLGRWRRRDDEPLLEALLIEPPLIGTWWERVHRAITRCDTIRRMERDDKGPDATEKMLAALAKPRFHRVVPDESTPEDLGELYERALRCCLDPALPELGLGPCLDLLPKDAEIWPLKWLIPPAWCRKIGSGGLASLLPHPNATSVRWETAEDLDELASVIVEAAEPCLHVTTLRRHAASRGIHGEQQEAMVGRWTALIRRKVARHAAALENARLNGRAIVAWAISESPPWKPSALDQPVLLNFPATVAALGHHVRRAGELADELDLPLGDGNLDALEVLLQHRRNCHLKPSDHPQDVFALGCWLGEATKRASGARWVQAALRDNTAWDLRLALEVRDGRRFHPIRVVRRRIEVGVEFAPSSFLERVTNANK